MNPIYEGALTERNTPHNVADFLLGRWSPRAMSGEILSEEELMTLFDAARWAPSAFNEQPWRFIYANRETPEWEKLNNLLGGSTKIGVPMPLHSSLFAQPTRSNLTTSQVPHTVSTQEPLGWH